MPLHVDPASLRIGIAGLGCAGLPPLRPQARGSSYRGHDSMSPPIS